MHDASETQNRNFALSKTFSGAKIIKLFQITMLFFIYNTNLKKRPHTAKTHKPHHMLKKL